MYHYHLIEGYICYFSNEFNLVVVKIIQLRVLFCVTHDSNSQLSKKYVLDILKYGIMNWYSPHKSHNFVKFCDAIKIFIKNANYSHFWRLWFSEKNKNIFSSLGLISIPLIAYDKYWNMRVLVFVFQRGYCSPLNILRRNCQKRKN